MFIMGVCGRQSGKSQHGADFVLRRAAKAPGGTSCLLVPTWRIGLAPTARLRELAAPLGAEWNETKQLLTLANGHRVWVRSADRPDATRGLTIDTTLWLDEAAYVSEAAWTSALGCLAAARSALVLITTTPAGKNNWVFRRWSAPDAAILRFYFRSSDSPFANEGLQRALRETMGAARAAQELDAIFTDDRTQPFKPEDIDRLLANRLPKLRGHRITIGWDWGKEKDWTVGTGMNEFGEARILGRWRHVNWPETFRRVEAIHGAFPHSIACVDKQQGGGYGGVASDFIAEKIGEARVLDVRTGNLGVKAKIIEALMADVEHGRLQADNERTDAEPSGGENAKQLRHELLFFTSVRKVVGGVEHVVYEGPQGEDEHDDTVISLALANWGRIHGWDRPEESVDFKQFVPPTGGGGGGGSSYGGYPGLGDVGETGYIYR